MRFVDGMTRSLDLGRVAVGTREVPLFQIGIDDLVGQSDDTPARLRLPGGCGQGCAKDFCRRKDLGARLEIGLFMGQIRCEEVGEFVGVKECKSVVGLLDRSLLPGENTGQAFPQGAFVLADIRSMRRNVNEADDMRIDAGLADDRAAIAVSL